MYHWKNSKIVGQRLSEHRIAPLEPKKFWKYVVVHFLFQSDVPKPPIILHLYMSPDKAVTPLTLGFWDENRNQTYSLSKELSRFLEINECRCPIIVHKGKSQPDGIPLEVKFKVEMEVN